jgi:hypothetical protein
MHTLTKGYGFWYDILNWQCFTTHTLHTFTWSCNTLTGTCMSLRCFCPLLIASTSPSSDKILFTNWVAWAGWRTLGAANTSLSTNWNWPAAGFSRTPTRILPLECCQHKTWHNMLKQLHCKMQNAKWVKFYSEAISIWTTIVTASTVYKPIPTHSILQGLDSMYIQRKSM